MAFLELKSCCCCIPLRIGLLIVGYLRLMTAVIAVLAFSIRLYIFTTTFPEELPQSVYRITATWVWILIVVLLGDAGFSMVLINGAEKKNPKLLKVFYYYTLVSLVLYMLGVILIYILLIASSGNFIFNVVPLLGFFGIHTLITVCYQIYMILLIQSEISKIKRNQNKTFRNVKNQDKEAWCNMDEELYVVRETVGADEVTETYIKNNRQAASYKVVNENEETKLSYS